MDTASNAMLEDEFGTAGCGQQGIMDTASNAMLEDEFGTARDDDVVQQIMERGTVIESEVRHFCLLHACCFRNANF